MATLAGSASAAFKPGAQPKERTTICESGITNLCFNAARTRCAFSPNSHLILVADCSAAPEDCLQWTIVETLEQHDQTVTGIAWSAATDAILSCAQDRTAFVWAAPTAPGAKREPALVMLDSAVRRGLTGCAWSVSGKKVYVASASTSVAAGYYDDANQWWYCKPIEKHASAVTCLAAHPTRDTILATGGSDCAVVVCTTTSKQVDGKDAADAKFGTAVAEFRALGGWVASVAWSPSGGALAFATHDSCVHVATFDISGGPSAAFCGDGAVVRRVALKSLPVRSLAFVGERLLIGGGYDYYPMLFTTAAAAAGSGGWRLAGRWTADDADLKKVKTSAELARERFQNQASTGQTEAVEIAKTKHKNTITSVVALVRDAADEKDSRLLCATASMDGRVEFWRFDGLVPV